MGAPGAGPQAPDDGRDRGGFARVAVRTALLAVSILLIFPSLLDRPTHGTWSRAVASLGDWRWAAWGACFVALTMLRFTGGPRRG